MADSAGRSMLRIAAITALIGPILVLGSDLIHSFGGLNFVWTIGLFWGFAMLIPPVIGLAYVCAKNGSRLALAAGCFASFGLVAGAGMQALFRVHAVLEEQGNMEAVMQLRQTFKLIASTQMIGLTWPIGLLLFSIASRKAWPGSYLVPILFLIGAISFPVGRILFVDASVILSGVVFLILFPLIANRLLVEARDN
jgi:hypothetical protein